MGVLNSAPYVIADVILKSAERARTEDVPQPETEDAQKPTLFKFLFGGRDEA